MNLNRRNLLRTSAVIGLSPISFLSLSHLYKSDTKALKYRLSIAIEELEKIQELILTQKQMNQHQITIILTFEYQLRYLMARDVAAEDLTFLEFSEIVWSEDYLSLFGDRKNVGYYIPELSPKPPTFPIITTVAPQTSDQKCTDNLTSIVIDILVETIEIQAIKAALIKVIEEVPFLTQITENLTSAIGANDWKKATTLLFEILNYFLLSSNYKTLIIVLGRKEFERVKEAIVTKFILRLVPFVGPAYLLVTFSTAFMGNYDRLNQLNECRKLKSNS